MTHLFAADLLLSLLAFGLYAWDKRAAKARRHRISERTLHIVAVLGGWPGALLAQRLLRHKTSKVPFRRVFWVTVALNLAATLIIVAFMRRIEPWSPDALVPASAKPI